MLSNAGPPSTLCEVGGPAKRGGRTTSRCHENQGEKYKYEHERAAARIDDDGRSAHRPVEQKTTINLYSGDTW